MNKIYNKNLKPKYSFCEDIRDFRKRDDLPKELYELDILDGSPPCSLFSSSNIKADEKK
jgi:DNA (cytosine-5)-methyltransferase 1